jgi:hypothetical protein
MALWGRSPGFSPLFPPKSQAVADDLFLLFLFHPPQPPQCSHSLSLRLCLRQHLSVPSGQKLRLRLRLRLQRTLPLRDWGLSTWGPQHPKSPAARGPCPINHGLPSDTSTDSEFGAGAGL